MKSKDIALTNSERNFIAGKVRLMEQGEQARMDLNAVIGCVVERAGKSFGEYQLSADLTTLKFTPTAPPGGPTS